MMFDRGVRASTNRHGSEWLFTNVSRVLIQADLAVGNLECPLTTRVEPKPTLYNFRCDPSIARSLAEAGFDMLTMANNHALDQGRNGLKDTIANLRAVGIRALGAENNRDDAREPSIVERNGIRIAFLAFTAVPVEGIERSESNASLALADAGIVRKSVKAAKAKSDVVVVFFHWGTEFSGFPSDSQKSLAAAAVDAGASLVVGHHPHVMQTVEKRKGALIVYSLGNFVFDQKKQGGEKSVILRVALSRKGVEEHDFVPVLIRDGKPSIVSGTKQVK